MKFQGWLLISLLIIAAVHVRAEETTTEEEEVEEVAADSFTTEQREQISKSEEKFEFQAEVGRLMDILIKYLYSNKEVFLRELISNGSDALDKLRFLSLTDAKLMEGNEKLEIRITADKEKRLLTIRDTGVGMSREELIKNLGTVAKSGTTQFVDAMATGAAAGQDPLSLIGQFGVGFYSVYLVADWVTVASKSGSSADQYLWESAAQGTFTIAKDPRGNSLGRGTEITLRLKEDAKEFADFASLKRIVTKYSEFINFPIYIEEVKTVEKEVPLSEEELAAQQSEKKEEKTEDGVEVSEKKDEEEKPTTKKVSEEERTWIQVNEQKPIWTRNPKDVTEEEYNKFYRTLTKDSEDPLTHIHFVAEGDVSFRALLYIPKKAPANMYDNYYSKSSAIKLFVRRVLIAEEFDELMPRYLSFVKGVVESDDLPLNVNRETLQKSKLLQVIGKKLVQKALFMINQMVENDSEAKDDAEKEYETFWGQFGKSIRLGLIEDHSKNGKKLSKLLRFPSSKSDTPIALQAYVDNMKKSQDVIYYIAGEALAVVKASPFLEKLNKKGYEVLFMVDPLDEHAIQQVTEFDGKKLQSITKEGVTVKSSDKAKAKLDAAVEEYKGLCEYLTKLYTSAKVEKVIVSDRVVTSPAILSTAQYGWSANMERIMKAQALNDAQKNSHMLAKRTLELNPNHPIVQELNTRITADAEDDKVADLARLLYDAAALNSGFAVDDSKEFGERVYRVLASSLNVKAEVAATEEEAEEEEPAEEEEATTEAASEHEKPKHDEL